MKHTSITIFILLIGISPLIGQTATKVSCNLLPNFSSNERVNCGKLTVPENHAKPSGKQIEIAYAIIQSSNKDANSYPIMFFTGGPGGKTLTPGLINAFLTLPISKNRDIILFDQRGVQLSSALPDIGTPLFNVMATDADTDMELAMFRDSLEVVKAQCEREGIALGNYNSFENAKDVGVLMEHLGYEKYNLIGSSYGTRLARIVQSLFPEKINTSILDSPAHIQGDFLHSRVISLSLSIERMLTFCAQDDSCSTNYPDLKNKYLKAVKSLKDNPLAVPYGEGQTYYVNSQDAMYFLRRVLYSGDAKEKWPKLIEAIHNRDAKYLTEAVEVELKYYVKGINTSMLLSVESYAQFDATLTPTRIDSIYNTSPLLPEKLGFFNSIYIAGQNWHNNRLDRDKRQFEQSATPTLLLTNRYDPVTPPEEARKFEDKLSNCTLLIIDQAGHGSFDGSECMLNLFENFLEEKAVSSGEMACLKLYNK